MVCPSTRAATLAKIDGFIPIAEHYARDRNHVIPGHPSVSRLSPAIRHRLITEEEVVSTVLRVHAFSRVEKFIQEGYWRRYWKSWLSLRLEVWSDFLRDLDAISAFARLPPAGSSSSGSDSAKHSLPTQRETISRNNKL